MTVYVAEAFTPEESDILRRYFTNLDGPVFALVNLPEVVKGALFARYSRSAKSLRRLFLDEFVGDLDIEGDQTIDATIGLRRAEELYDRVFFEYGDDSVAQLGGVHLACEQASNVLTKVLEWGRLMSYLEQSTRYIAYDSRIGGRFRYHRDPAVLSSPLGTRYVGDMDRLFDSYAALLPPMQDWFREIHPKDPADSDIVYRQAIRAKAFDALRGILPAASLSNVGIYGTGQGYEQLLLRMRAHPLPEARTYADLMLYELRKVIPSFLKRVDLADRGVAWSDYMAGTRQAMDETAARLFPAQPSEPPGPAPDDAPQVTLVDFDPDAEIKLVAAMLYPYVSESEAAIERRVADMTVDERLAVIDAYVGDRSNRRHKPGRALERVTYRFDILADYGAFRDLQRHRMLTVEWQRLTPAHGYTRPAEVDLAGLADPFDEAMARSASLHDALAGTFPEQASYAVALAYRVRFSMQFNAREAMHLLELRTTPQGHPAYRSVAQEMHTAIGEVAGHRAIAAMMRFVDHSAGADLERLEAERRAEQRRQGR
ncbi:MAG: FAD-dependent thymidylate synthase [Acidimicrobiales bacterium]